MSDARLKEALLFLAATHDERAKHAKSLIGQVKAPPVLDDEVMNELFDRDLIQLRVADKNKIPLGAVVATDGRGNLAVVEVTEKGRAFSLPS